MNLSSTSWIHQPDDSYIVEELQCAHHGSVSGRVSTGSLRPLERLEHRRSLRAPDAFQSTPAAALCETHKIHVLDRRVASPPPPHIHQREISVRGRAHLLRGRTRSAVLIDLQRIRGEANAFVLRRLLLRWGLHATRCTALRQLQHDTRQLLWRRLGGRCFAWWRLVTERRLCREALYLEAARREAAWLRDGVCRVAWVAWQRWARMRARRRDRATRLSLVNRQRHALARWEMWAAFPRRCAALRRLQAIRFCAERRLARFALVRWRLRTLENYLTFPLEVTASQQAALTAFRVWQRRARVGAQLRRLQQEAAWDLSVSAFQKWKRWLRRRLQAALLQRANETRQLLHVFTQWAWQHQLKALAQQQ